MVRAPRRGLASLPHGAGRRKGPKRPGRRPWPARLPAAPAAAGFAVVAATVTLGRAPARTAEPLTCTRPRRRPRTWPPALAAASGPQPLVDAYRVEVGHRVQGTRPS